MVYLFGLYYLLVKDHKILTSQTVLSCWFNTQKHMDDAEKIINSTCLSLLITLFLQRTK